MEADFERLPQFSPVLGTTDLTKPVIQVKIEKQERRRREWTGLFGTCV